MRASDQTVDLKLLQHKFASCQLELAPSIHEALSELKGNAGLALSTTIAFEQSNWQKLNWTALAKFELNAKQINEIYFEASRMALEISAEN